MTAYYRWFVVNAYRKSTHRLTTTT